MGRAASIILSASLVAAGGVGGWALRAIVAPSGAKEGKGDEEPAAAEVKPEEMQVEVTSAPVRAGPLAVVVSAIGVVKTDPAATYTLALRAGGRVASTSLTPGASVKKGEVLLEIDPAPLETAVTQARASLAQASSALDEFDKLGRDRRRAELDVAAEREADNVRVAEAQVARLESLHESGLVSDKALEEARQTAGRARQDRRMADQARDAFRDGGGDFQRAGLLAARTSAEAALKDAQDVRADVVLRAPADGQVVAAAVSRGDRVEPGAALGTLLLAQSRVVAFQVTARLVREIRDSAPASWHDADGGHCSGRVLSILKDVESATGLVEVRVLPDAACPLLQPGLVVRGEIERSRVADALLVPDRAVVRSGDRQVVVLVGADGRAHVRPVKVLGRHDGVTAVSGELLATDRVIVEGGYNLPDGARVVERGATGAPEKPDGATEGGK